VEDQQLVQLALQRRFLTGDQVDRARAEQKALADRGVQRSVWFLCQDLGFVTDAQTRDLQGRISSTRIRALEVEGYVIEGRLGNGGMGDVFRACNAVGQVVAVKLLATKFAQNAEYARRFQREARATLRLNHPHITRSLGAGEVQGQRYLMMELIAGPSLKEWITTRGPLAQSHGILLLRQMAEALRYAWDAGVLHRDVKPANIILGPLRPGSDEHFCAKICDFGLAKVWQEGDEGTRALSRGELTGTGIALGTPHYMSPEQASGEHDLDQRSDIYGLGATLYHALLGQTLYSGKSSAVIMYKQVTEALDLEPLAAKGIAPGLIALLAGMLAKEKAHRLRDWDAVLTGLRPLLPPPPTEMEPAAKPSASIRALLDGPTESSQRPSEQRRHPAWLVRIVGLAVVAVVGLSAIGYTALRRAPSATWNATPETLSQVLAEAAASTGVGEVMLAAGDYPGPWRLGVAHSRLCLRAAPGARLVVGPGEGAALRLEPGLVDCRILGLTIVAPGRLAIEALPGARAHLAGCTIASGCDRVLAATGAELTIAGLRCAATGSGLHARGGRLELSDLDLAGAPPLIAMQQVDVLVERSRLSASSGGGALISIAGGTCTLRALVVDAPGCAVALALDRVERSSLAAVELRQARIGMAGTASVLASIDGLTIDAVDEGVRWSGTWKPEWHWRQLRLKAPRLASGLPEEVIAAPVALGR